MLSIEKVFLKNNIFGDYVFLDFIAFFLLGSSLKLIDFSFDKGFVSKKPFLRFPLVLLAGLTAGFWVYVMSLSVASATILAAILISVFVAKKIDNVAFLVGLIIILFSLLFFQTVFHFLWVPLIFISLAGVLDEIGNDYVDKNKVNKFVDFFFKHRFVMKLGVLAFGLLNFFEFIYFIAFLFFDLGYDLVQYFLSKNKFFS
jgi:hypothetical protein